jgi:hypothetical protein
MEQKMTYLDLAIMISEIEGENHINDTQAVFENNQWIEKHGADCVKFAPELTVTDEQLQSFADEIKGDFEEKGGVFYGQEVQYYSVMSTLYSMADDYELSLEKLVKASQKT